MKTWCHLNNRITFNMNRINLVSTSIFFFFFAQKVLRNKNRSTSLFSLVQYCLGICTDFLVAQEFANIIIPSQLSSHPLPSTSDQVLCRGSCLHLILKLIVMKETTSSIKCPWNGFKPISTNEIKNYVRLKGFLVQTLCSFRGPVSLCPRMGPVVLAPRLRCLRLIVLVFFVTWVFAIHVGEFSEPGPKVGQVVEVEITFICDCGVKREINIS